MVVEVCQVLSLIHISIVGLGVDGALLFSQRGKDEVKQTGLEVPVNLKYTIGLGSLLRIYVAAGPDLSLIHISVCHVCRTVCRRAERRILALAEQVEDVYKRQQYRVCTDTGLYGRCTTY